jgi:hypothetical protein
MEDDAHATLSSLLLQDAFATIGLEASAATNTICSSPSAAGVSASALLIIYP